MVSTANETIILLIKVVIVVIQIVHGYHSLAMILVDFAIDTIALDATDVRIKLFTDMLTHEFHHLVLDGVTLGIGCHLLHVRTMLAQTLVIVLVGAAATLCISCQQAVNHHVWITPDGRREVCVIVESQAKVSYIINGVLRLHHRSESDGLYEFLFIRAVNGFHQTIKTAGSLSLCPCRFHLIAEFHDKIF